MGIVLAMGRVLLLANVTNDLRLDGDFAAGQIPIVANGTVVG